MKNKLKERIKEIYKEYKAFSSMDNEIGSNYRLRSNFTEQDLDQYALKVLVDLYTTLDEEVEEKNRLIYHGWDVIEPTIELILEEKDIDK